MRGRMDGMNESEAVAKAREVIFAKTGVDAEPHSVEFKSVGGRHRWSMHFPGHIVIVNDDTGEVAGVFESHPNKPPWERS